MAKPIPLINQIDDDTLLKYYKESTTLIELYQKIGYKSADTVGKKHKELINEKLSQYGLSIDTFKKEHNINQKIQQYCINCGKPVNNLYCSTQCQKELRDKKLIEHWLETGETGCSVQTTLRNAIRDYIYKSQDHKCAICGIPNEWNGMKLNFVLDHIDGDASNNFQENLRLICPNCDSQLDTYKSRNKKSARKHRKNYV